MILVLIKTLAAFGFGALGCYGMAPHNIWALMLVSLAVFYIILSSAKNTQRAGLYGFAYAYGYFTFSLSWVGNALLVEDNPYAWAYPLALLGAPLLLAWVLALGGMFYRKLLRDHTFATPLLFAGIITLCEWVRGRFVFGGFPWNSFGYAWADQLEMLQIISFDNVYLLTFLTAFWAGALGFLCVSRIKGQKIAVAFIATLTAVAVYSYGSYRLENTQITFDETASFKIIQPNIAQKDKWDPALFYDNFYTHLDLSRTKRTPSLKELDARLKKSPAPDHVTYIIWPETALTSRHLSDETVRLQLKNMLHSYPGYAYVMSGILRRDAETGDLFNSFGMLDKDFQLSNVYDKHHLVPFGEYIPFQSLIQIDTVSQFSGFIPGGGPTNMAALEGYSYSPLICYESIFPHLSIDHDNERPDFMINVANDAWYGDSAGPYQHFIQGRFRAIEAGIPFVRSTGTGVSGIVDPMGRVLQQTTLFTVDVVESKLPLKLNNHNDWLLKGYFFFILSGLSLAFYVLFRKNLQ